MAVIGTAEGILKLRDEFSGRMDRASSKLDRTAAKSEQAARRISRSGDRIASGYNKITASLGKLGLAVGGLVAAQKLTAFMDESIGLAVEQAQALGQVEQGLRSTAGAVGFTTRELAGMAAELQRVTTIGDETFLRVQSVLLTFTKITGEQFRQATELAADLATRVGQDLTSSALMLGKALNDPVANLGALSRAGIQFDERQKEIIKTLFESGRVMEAQNLLIAEMTRQFGGSARAAADAAGGGLKQYANAVGDIQEKVGNLLLPTLDDLSLVLISVSDGLERSAEEIRETALEAKSGTRLIEGLGVAFLALRSVPIIGALADSRIQLKGMAEDIRSARMATEDGIRQIERYSDELVESTLSMRSLDDHMDGYLKTLTKTTDKQEEFAAALHRTAAERVQRVADIYRELAELAEEYRRELEKIQALDILALEPFSPGRIKEIGVGLAKFLDPSMLAEFGRQMKAQLDGIFRDLAGSFFFGILEHEGSLRDLFRQIGEEMAVSIANAVAVSLSAALQTAGMAAGPAGVLGAIGGAVAGRLFGSITSKLFGGQDEKLVRRFFGVASLLGSAAEALDDAATALNDLVRNLRGELLGVARALGGFSFLTGEGIPDSSKGVPGGSRPGGFDDQTARAMVQPLLSLVPNLEVAINQIGDQFAVSIVGVVTGWGDSIQSATKEMLDKIVQRIPILVEQGVISLEGVPKILADAFMSTANQTWEDLKASLDVASRFFLASIGTVRADLFNFFAQLRSDVSEAVRLGLDPQGRRQGTLAQIEQFISGLLGVEGGGGLVNVRQFVNEFARSLEGLGLTLNRQEQLTRQAEMAARLYNRALRLGPLAELAAMAEEFGVQARFVRRIKVMEVKLQFEILRVQLKAFDLWEKTRDIWRQVRNFALDVARGMGETAERVAGGRGSSSRGTDGFPSGPIDVNVVSLPEPTSVTQAWNEFRKAAIARLDSVAANTSPFDQLKTIMAEISEWGGALLNPPILRAAQAALDRIVESIKAPLREFVEGLRFGPFGMGTPGDKARGAFQALQEAVLAVMAGDYEKLSEIQGLADLALQLGSSAFGTSTQAFSDFFGGVTDLVNLVLGAGFDIDPANLTIVPDATTNAVLDQTVVLQSHLSAVREEERRQGEGIIGRLDTLISVVSAPSLRGAPV